MTTQHLIWQQSTALQEAQPHSGMIPVCALFNKRHRSKVTTNLLCLPICWLLSYHDQLSTRDVLLCENPLQLAMHSCQ